MENFLLKAIRIGIALALFTPLVFGPFGLDLVSWPQAVFFRVIIEIIFCLYVFLLLLDKKYLPKISPLLISILAFDTILIISSIFGINFYRSFFGDMQRGEGIIMHLHLLVFFVVLISIFKEKEDWLDLFKISVFASAISSFAAILQQFSIVQLFNMYPPRISGTMNNPDLFAVYTSLSIFIALFLLNVEKNKKFRLVWLFLAILNCYTLFFSGTRGSILATGLGLAVILFSVFLKLDYKKRLTILFTVLAFFIFALIMFSNPALLVKLPGGSVLARFTEFNLNGRDAIWKAAPPAFMARPLLGWGQESFTFISDKYMTAGLTNGTYYDRPHNKILEVLLYSGIIGLLSYLSIFIIIFYLLFKHKKNDYLIFLAFFICYFVQNLFLFDTTCTYILFFLVAAFLSNNFSNKTEFSAEEKGENKVAPIKIFFAVLIFLLMSEIMYQVNIKPTMAAMYFPSFVVYENSNPEKAFHGYEKATIMNTIYDGDLIITFTMNSLKILANNPSLDNLRREIVAKLTLKKPFLRKNMTGNCEQINTLLANIDEQEYLLNKNQNDLNEMDAVLKKATALNPHISDYYTLIGEMEILKNNYKGGEADIKKGCFMDGCSDDELYKKIGSAYSKIGDLKKEILNYQKSFDIIYGNYKNQGEKYNFDHIDFLKFTNYIGTTYCQKLEDLQNCEKIFKQGVEMLPEYAKILTMRIEQLETVHN